MPGFFDQLGYFPLLHGSESGVLARENLASVGCVLG